MTLAPIPVQNDNPINSISESRGRVLIGVVVFASLLSGYMCYMHARRVRVSYLELSIRSSVTSTAQIFYDTGKGLSEAESQKHLLQAGNTFHSLKFPLPNRPIRLLRFDPLAAGSGRVVIRKVELVRYDGSLEQVLPLESLHAANDIASMRLTGDELVIEMVPNSKDPQTIFALQYPIVPPRPSRIWTAVIGLSWFIGAAIFCSAILFAVPKLLSWSALRLKLAAIDLRFDFAARKISNSDVIVFDRFAIWFYTICILGFLIMCFAGLHGSSIDIFSSVYHYGAPGVEPLIGTPKGIRSDEWNYQTPLILNQSLRPDRFSPKDTYLGPGNAGLIANAPMWHFTTVFRPEFWGFFVLPFNYAYSAYWEAKWFILLTGLFTLLLLVTHSSAASAVGALWFLFSAFTQWQLSWPSQLPDLVGLCCWIICLICYLLAARSLTLACVAAVCLIICTIDFAMCAYIPHQIPLAWFALFVIAFWTTAKSFVIWEPRYGFRRLAVITLTLCSIALICGLLFRDIAETIRTVASTSYPGHRLVSGGAYGLPGLGSHLLDLWKTESHFPPRLGNICEGSGFLWLAPVTFFCFSRVAPLDRKQKLAFVCLGLVFILIWSWEVLPVPASIARFTLFDRVPAGRALPALGLANVMLVTTALAWRREYVRRSFLKHFIEVAGIFSITLIILVLINLSLGSFWEITAVLGAAILITLSTKSLVEGWVVSFGVVVLVPLLAAYSFVNPLGRGFSTIFRSELFQTVQSHPALRQGKWLVFSRELPPPGFFAAVGCNVFNGLKYVPDLKDLSLFDRTGTNYAKFNRSGYFLVDLSPNGSSEEFETTPSIILWKVNPLDPRLRQIGIRYLAFQSPPPPAILQNLKPAANNPVSTFWLYELP